MRGPPDTFAKSDSTQSVQNNGSSLSSSRHEIGGASDGENSVDAQYLLDQYGWMINSEESEREIWAELEQEDQIDQLYEKACQEEERYTYHGNQTNGMISSNSNRSDLNMASAESQMEKLTVNGSHLGLNPEATEFIPRSRRRSSAAAAATTTDNIGK